MVISSAEMTSKFLGTLCSVLLWGCASTSQLAEQPISDDLARFNWMLSAHGNLLDFRQEAIVIPAPYNGDEDQLKSEIKRDGYITGYDYIRSGDFLHCDIPTAPRSIINHSALAEIWNQACRTAASNAFVRLQTSTKKSETTAGSHDSAANGRNGFDDSTSDPDKTKR